ncbi:hypothetical protein [Anaerobutyricum hallii]|uniref:hypothetical protein n=1 Tax=Anaerobutyricum hallii TaxID=39488 RepID=UPI003AB723A1
MASGGYYALYDYPKEMTTDTAGTFKMSKIDMTTNDVTYSFKYDFICDGVTTSKTVATGLTATQYTWTPTTAIFAPLMTKSDQGTLKVAIESSNGRRMTYYATIALKLKASIKPSSTFQYVGDTGFNNKAIAGITSFTFTINVPGLYGASQTVKFTIKDTDYVQNVPAVSGTTNTAVTFDVGTFACNDPTAMYTRWFFKIEITDSRGRSDSRMDWVTIYSYSPPDVVATVDRNADEKPVLTFTPSYQATVAGATNSITIFWARCNVDGEVYETDLKGKTSPQVLVGTYDLSKAYQFTIAINDSVRPSAIIKRIILPSAMPVMDIGADGKTVTFFGTSPNSADKNTLRVGDVASFGEEVVLGDTSNSYTVVKATGLTVHDKNTVVGDDTDVIASIGIGNTVNASGSKVTGPFYTLGVRSFNEVDGVGIQPTENGLYSMVEGWLCEASGYASHAEGNACCASGHLSHAGGMNSGASGFASFAHGYGLRANGEYQAVFGMNNIVDTSNKYLLIVGNGPGDGTSSNALGVTANGHIDVQKNIYINTNGSGIFERDTDGTNRELIAMDGNNKLSIGYGQYSHGGRETVLQGGNKLTLRLKNPNATWRPYMTKGDSFNTTIQVGGYITNSGKDVTFQLPLNNPVIGSPTVTIASVDGLCVRQNNKYLYGSAASTFAKPSSYSCTLGNGGNHIKITAKMANTTNVENNSACGIYASIKVTFS